MKFEYIGTDDGPRAIVFHGIRFEKGLVVDVSPDQVFTIPKTNGSNLEVKVIDKLRGNRCFREVRQKKEAKKDAWKPSATEVPEPTSQDNP